MHDDEAMPYESELGQCRVFFGPLPVPSSVHHQTQFALNFFAQTPLNPALHLIH